MQVDQVPRQGWTEEDDNVFCHEDGALTLSVCRYPKNSQAPDRIAWVDLKIDRPVDAEKTVQDFLDW